MSKLVTPSRLVCASECAGLVEVGTCSWRLLLTRIELCSDSKCSVFSTLDQLVFPVHLFPKWARWEHGKKCCWPIVLLELMFPLYQVTNCQIVERKGAIGTITLSCSTYHV